MNLQNVVPVGQNDYVVETSKDLVALSSIARIGSRVLCLEDNKVYVYMDVNKWETALNLAGGPSNATHWVGVTTTALTDGATTDPVVINGENVAAELGAMVSYGPDEFVWNGSAWQKFGGDSETFRVTVTNNTADRTFADTLAAFNAGKFVYAIRDTDLYYVNYVSNQRIFFYGYLIDDAIVSSAPDAVNRVQRGFILQDNNTITIEDNFVLPWITSSDNGMLLGVNNGQWTKVDPPSGLPSVTESDNSKVLMTNDIGEIEWGDFPDPSNIFAVTVVNDGSYYVSQTFADTKAAYDAGKTVVLFDGSYIIPLIEVNSSYMVFKCVNSSGQIIGYNFHDTGNVYYSLSNIVNSVNGSSGDIIIGLEASNGFLNISGSGADVLNGMAVTSISYDSGGSTFAQLLAVVVQSLASSNSCHLKMGSLTSHMLASLMYHDITQYGAIGGLMVSVNNLNTIKIILIPCGGGILADQGFASYRAYCPAPDLGTDVLVDVVLTITTDGQIYIDAEKFSNYTDLGGQTISQLTAEIQQAFEAVTYADYDAMEVDNDYTIGNYTWRCTSNYESNRSFSGTPQGVSYNVDVTLDSENGAVYSVDVFFLD